MADSCLPAAIDWLVAEGGTAVRAAVSTVVISDGWPTETAEDEVVIGMTPRDDETEGEQEYIAIGQQVIDEQWDVPIEVTAFRGGSSQKVARDACFVMFNALLAKIRTDLTLGGACKFPVSITRPVCISTSDSGTAGTGRRSSVLFSVHLHHRI